MDGRLMKKFIPFLILALVWIGWSCSSDNKEEITPTPTPEPEETVFEITSEVPVMEQKGGTATITLTTSMGWKTYISDQNSYMIVDMYSF